MRSKLPNPNSIQSGIVILEISQILDNDIPSIVIDVLSMILSLFLDPVPVQSHVQKHTQAPLVDQHHQLPQVRATACKLVSI